MVFQSVSLLANSGTGSGSGNGPVLMPPQHHRLPSCLIAQTAASSTASEATPGSHAVPTPNQPSGHSQGSVVHPALPPLPPPVVVDALEPPTPPLPPELVVALLPPDPVTWLPSEPVVSADVPPEAPSPPPPGSPPAPESPPAGLPVVPPELAPPLVVTAFSVVFVVRETPVPPLPVAELATPPAPAPSVVLLSLMWLLLVAEHAAPAVPAQSKTQ